MERTSRQAPYVWVEIDATDRLYDLGSPQQIDVSEVLDAYKSGRRKVNAWGPFVSQLRAGQGSVVRELFPEAIVHTACEPWSAAHTEGWDLPDLVSDRPAQVLLVINQEHVSIDLGISAAEPFPQARILVLSEAPIQLPGWTVVELSKADRAASAISAMSHPSGGIPGHPEIVLRDIKKLARMKTPVSEWFVQALRESPFDYQSIAQVVAEERIHPYELMELLKPFRSPGLVGPDGEPLDKGSPQLDVVIHDIVAVNDRIIEQLAADQSLIYRLSDRQFEELVADLLSRLGYSVHLTPPTKDGGVDIFAASKTAVGNFLFLVECKHWDPRRPVGVSAVRELRGVVEASQATGGLLVTSSYFTRGARELQRESKHRITLKDYIAISRWIRDIESRAGES